MSGGGHRHPTDQVIGELARKIRRARPGEIDAIIDRMATAPFDPRDVRVRRIERGLVYQGRTLADRVESLTVHLIRRVVIEGQWAFGTTADDYLADLRSTVRSPDARLAVYERRGGFLAATLTPTDRAVPAVRRGPQTLPELLVVYAADRGIIVSGYQVSALAATGIPEDAVWLK